MTSMLISGRHISKLSGYAPALPTPFDEEGTVDASAFERLCDLQLANGATALVVCGTTGEAPTLSPAEHRELIRIAVAQARGRIPVIAGAGANATAHAIELTRDAEATGADAALSVVPYYNKPTQSGFTPTSAQSLNPRDCRLFSMTCHREPRAALPTRQSLDWPNYHSSSGLRMRRATLAGRRDYGRWSGRNFRLLCGDDGLALPYLAQGGDGCISVTSNVAPGLCRNMFLAWKHGQSVRAQRLAHLVAELTAALFRETNPVPVKHALALLGLMSPTVRLPLVGLSGPHREDLSKVIFRLCVEHSRQMIGSIDKTPESCRRAVG